jgi:hypothetical protein
MALLFIVMQHGILSVRMKEKALDCRGGVHG